ncbi:hypothetical protein KY361_04595 [Candidatus Woesearchaeota archaeon]|nr:hypothetical protein [Candidatus Woesearchaeota archaeon]
MTNTTGNIAVFADGLANKEAHTAAYRRLVRDILDGTPVTNIFYLGNFIGPGADAVECVEFLQDPARFAGAVADSRGEVHELSEEDYITPSRPGGICPTIYAVVAGKYERGFCAGVESMPDDAVKPEFDNKRFVFTKDEKEFEEEIEPALQSHAKAFFGGYRPKAFSEVVHKLVDALRAGNPDGAHIEDRVDLIAKAIVEEEYKEHNLSRKLAEVGREARSYGSIDPSFGPFDIRLKRPKGLLAILNSCFGLSERGRKKLLYDQNAAEFFMSSFSTSPSIEKAMMSYASVKRGLYAYAYLLLHSGMLPGEDGQPADDRVTDGITLDGIYMCNDSPFKPGSGRSLDPESPEFQRDFTNFMEGESGSYHNRHNVILYANTGRYGVVHDEHTGRLWINVGSIGSYIGEDPAEDVQGKGAFTILNPGGTPDAPDIVARRVRFKYDLETSEGKRLSMLREASG